MRLWEVVLTAVIRILVYAIVQCMNTGGAGAVEATTMLLKTETAGLGNDRDTVDLDSRSECLEPCGLGAVASSRLIVNRLLHCE